MTFRNCQVCCQVKDISHRRYGAYACMACATFFVRSARQNSDYRCHNNGICLNSKFFLKEGNLGDGVDDKPGARGKEWH